MIPISYTLRNEKAEGKLVAMDCFHDAFLLMGCAFKIKKAITEQLSIISATIILIALSRICLRYILLPCFIEVSN